MRISAKYQGENECDNDAHLGDDPKPELLKLLAALAPGDVVTVTRIGRLARSTFDLFGIVKRIVGAKGQFRSLAEPWAGTSTGRLMLAVLDVLANVERDLIRTRTAEARSRAKAQGQEMGRPLP